MTIQITSRWLDYAAGFFVFCLLLSSGVSVVLYGRFDIGFLLLFTGIVTAVVAFLYSRRRPGQTGHLITILVYAILFAVAGTGGVIVLGDAIIHHGGVNPEPSSSGTGLAEPWLPPDAGILSNDLNDTAALLIEPIGGFTEGRIFVWSKSPEGSANYTLLARNMTPTTVQLRVFPVEEVRSSAEHAPYEDLEVSITPDQFTVVPGQSYTAQFRVNLTSTRYDDTLRIFPYYVQVRSGSSEKIIADDWIFVYAGGAIVPGVSGFAHGYASLNDSDRELTVKAGETCTATYLNRPGIGGAGFVQYNLSLISGDLNMMPMPKEEKRPFPPGMQVTVSPNNYTARSFGYYPSVITVKTAPELPPGDCHILVEADGLGTNDQFVVHVRPAQETAAGWGRPCRSNEEWHIKAEETGAWREGILVQEGMDGNAIRSLVQAYTTPASPSIQTSAPHYIGYYVSLTEAENRTLREVAEERPGEWNLSFSSSMYGFAGPSVKEKDGHIIAPVFITYDNRMNETEVFENLIRRNVTILRANVVGFDLSGAYSPPERDLILQRLSADNRVLFAFREYLEGVLC